MLGNELDSDSLVKQIATPVENELETPSPRHPKRDSNAEKSEEEEPVFEPPKLAPELWLHVASYLGPGKQSVARLSATCLELHHLLTPVFMEEIDMNGTLRDVLDTWCSGVAAMPLHDIEKRLKKRVMSWEHKVQFVRKLVASQGPGPWLCIMTKLEKLDMFIASVKHARMFGCFKDWPLFKLKDLGLFLGKFVVDFPGQTNIGVERPYLPFNFQLNFPEVEVLRLDGYYVERIGHAAQQGCPKLRTIHVDVADDMTWFSEHPPPIPGSFLGKIETWEEENGYWAETLTARDFAPKKVVIRDMWNLATLRTQLLPPLPADTTVICHGFRLSTDDDFHQFQELIVSFENMNATLRLGLRANDVKWECGSRDSRYKVARLVLAWFEQMENPDRNPRLDLFFNDDEGEVQIVAEAFGADDRQNDHERAVCHRAAWVLDRWKKQQRS